MANIDSSYNMASLLWPTYVIAKYDASCHYNERTLVLDKHTHLSWSPSLTQVGRAVAGQAPTIKYSNYFRKK